MGPLGDLPILGVLIRHPIAIILRNSHMSGLSWTGSRVSSADSEKAVAMVVQGPSVLIWLQSGAHFCSKLVGSKGFDEVIIACRTS